MDSFDMVIPTNINEGNLVTDIPMYCAPEWSSAQSYYLGKFVYHNGVFYRALTSTALGEPGLDPSKWAVETQELLFAPWDNTVTYDEGDRVAINYARDGQPIYRANAGKIFVSLTGSNLGNDPETSPDDWLQIAETYTPDTPDISESVQIGYRTIVNRRIYEAIKNSPVGTDPSISPDWILIGPANRWAMFDDQTGTQTTLPGEFWFTVDASGWVDQLSLLNISASNIHVTVKDDNDVIVFDEDIPLVSTENVKSIYEYFFSPIKTLTDVYIDIPATFKPTVTVTVTGQPAAIGHVVMGQLKRFGLTMSGAEIGIDDFSRKVRDDFGGYTIVERPFVRRGQFDVLLDNEEVDTIYRILSDIRATPALFIASQRFTSLYYFGLARSWGIRFDHRCNSILRIEVEGLS